MDTSGSSDTCQEVAAIMSGEFLRTSTPKKLRSRRRGACSLPTPCRRRSSSSFTSSGEYDLRPYTTFVSMKRQGKTVADTVHELSMFDLAAQGEVAKIEERLIDNSLINATDDNRFTMLMYAAHYSQTDTVQYLLRRGAKADASGVHGETVLSLAANIGNCDIMSMCLELPDVDIDKSDQAGNTALIYAAHSANVRCVQMLLEKGANVSIKNADNLSAFDIAVKMKHSEVQQAIEDHILLLLS